MIRLKFDMSNKMSQSQKPTPDPSINPKHRESTQISSIMNYTNYHKTNHPSMPHNMNIFLPINQYRKNMHRTLNRLSKTHQLPTGIISLKNKQQTINFKPKGYQNHPNYNNKKKDRYQSEQNMQTIEVQTIFKSNCAKDKQSLKFEELEKSLIQEDQNPQYQQTRSGGKKIKLGMKNRQEYKLKIRNSYRDVGGNPKTSCPSHKYSREASRSITLNTNSLRKTNSPDNKNCKDLSKIKLSRLFEYERKKQTIDEQKLHKINRLPINYNQCCEYFQSEQHELRKIIPEDLTTKLLSNQNKFKDQESSLVYKKNEDKDEHNGVERLQSPKFIIKIGKNYYSEPNNNLKETNYQDFGYMISKDGIKKARNVQLSKNKYPRNSAKINTQVLVKEKYTPWEITNEEDLTIYEGTYI